MWSNYSNNVLVVKGKINAAIFKAVTKVIYKILSKFSYKN